jgi:hypothetical protein
MHGPTCIFWTDLTPFSLQGKAQCAACLQKNSAALMKIGCHASDETKFCEA